MALTPARFEELYQEYQRYVFAICRQWLADEEDAADVALEVFVRKWRNIHKYDPALASFKTWLTRNTVNLCIETGRRPVRDQEPMPDDERDLADFSMEFDDRALQHAILGECLQALSADARRMLLMHAMLGYTWEEIGAVTGLPVGTARSRVKKAMEALRAELETRGIADARALSQY